MPGVVLVKTPGRWPNPLTPDLDERWSAAEQLLAEHSGAVRIESVDSGHHLQDEVPDLVGLAVRSVVHAVKDGTPVTFDSGAVAAAGGSLDCPRQL